MNRICFGILSSVPTSPLEIFKKANGIDTSSDSVYKRLDLSGLYTIFRYGIVIASAIAILTSLCVILFAKGKVLGEKKQDIEFKMFLLLFSGISVQFMNLLYVIGKSLII